MRSPAPPRGRTGLCARAALGFADQTRIGIEALVRLLAPSFA
jgi:hypothetical protein